MTDKVQKIREEIKMVVNRRLNLLNGDYFNLIKETDGFTNEIMDIIDTMQEEPVSEKKCIFTKDNYTDEDRKVLCEDCKEKCEYSKKEEPVSEDLGEYINELSKQFPEVSFAKLSRIAVRVAKWQKAKDQETIETAIHHAYHNGRFEMKEQMMKNAIDAKIGSFTNGTIYDADSNIDSNLKDNSKVKVIVIKED